ncbi:MAG: EFR1 family ferrodoxin [Elusimicrobiota bacterium]
MKIFYFSGTGNTLMMAKTLSENLTAEEVDVQLVNIESCRENVTEPGREFILMFPVYAYGPPKMVRNFIDNLRQGNGIEKVYLVLNYGLLPVNTFSITAGLLKKKGYRTVYSAGHRMPANYINLYNPRPPDVTGQGYKAVPKLESIAKDIIDGKENIIPAGSLFLRLPMKMIYSLFLKISDWMGTKFRFDGKCTKCGICSDLCPVKNITFSRETGPGWGKNCEQCMRCIHLCPEKAIQWFSVTKKRRRYKNPTIELKELYRP